VNQEYLKENLLLYDNSNIGFEKTLNEWIVKIKEQK
jgi:putative ATPase